MNLLVSKWIRSCEGGRKKPCQRVMWTALETPELLWRRVFEALMGSWRLCSTSDMLKQTPLHKMQMGSVWVLAKYGKMCSGRFISRSTKSPPLNGNPGLFSHPELEGARLLYVLGRVRRNYVYSGNRLPQSFALSVHHQLSDFTLEIQQPFLSGYIMENHHLIVQMQPAHTGAIFEMSCPSLGWRNHGNASPAIFQSMLHSVWLSRPFLPPSFW